MISEAEVESGVYGRPAVALQKIAKYDALFTDHPLLTLEKSDQFGFSGQSTGSDADVVRYLSQAFVWLGRQTRKDMMILHNPETFFPELLDGPIEDRHIELYDFDFPGRPDIAFRFPAKSEAKRWHWENCYRYALFRVECLQSLHYQLFNGPDADPKAAEAVLKQLEYRFIGHPKHLQVLTGIQRESGAADDEESLLQAAIQAGSDEWFAYQSLGVLQMRDGRYADASATFLAYPAFSDTSLAKHITLSNRAYNIGSLLYWAGAHEDARPLYEFSAGLRTGSDASLSSAVRLSILDGNLSQAAEITLQRVRRYESNFAYRDYMAFLHLQGRSDESWTLFSALMQNDAVYGPQLWTSAYLGHRINGATDQEIIDWAMDPRHAFLTKGKTHEFPVRFVFLMSVIDRLPSAELESIIREIHPDFANDANLTVIRVQDEYTDLETNFSYDHHRTALAARGLAHFHRGQLEEAFAAFDQIGPSRNIKEFLPYYAWCAVQTNQTDRLDKIMESAPIRIKEMEGDGHTGYQFDDYLAQSLIAGANGNHEDALKLLRRALNHRAFTESRKIFTYYQVLEVAEILYNHTGEDAFRQLGFDLAHRFTVIQPMYPWAYSFAAQFAESSEERIPYLATAMHLDPNSWRANNTSEEDREHAREWLETHGPLYERGIIESESNYFERVFLRFFRFAETVARGIELNNRLLGY